MGTHITQFTSAKPCCFSDKGERLLRGSAVAKRLQLTPRAVRYWRRRGAYRLSNAANSGSSRRAM